MSQEWRWNAFVVLGLYPPSELFSFQHVHTDAACLAYTSRGRRCTHRLSRERCLMAAYWLHRLSCVGPHSDEALDLLPYLAESMICNTHLGLQYTHAEDWIEAWKDRICEEDVGYWDPLATLDLQHVTTYTCIGWATSKHRECENRIAVKDWDHALRMLNGLAAIRPQSARARDRLPRVARLMLCSGVHGKAGGAHDQRGDAVTTWERCMNQAATVSIANEQLLTIMRLETERNLLIEPRSAIAAETADPNSAEQSSALIQEDPRPATPVNTHFTSSELLTSPPSQSSIDTDRTTPLISSVPLSMKSGAHRERLTSSTPIHGPSPQASINAPILQMDMSTHNPFDVLGDRYVENEEQLSSNDDEAENEDTGEEYEEREEGQQDHAAYEVDDSHTSSEVFEDAEEYISSEEQVPGTRTIGAHSHLIRTNSPFGINNATLHRPHDISHREIEQEEDQLDLLQLPPMRPAVEGSSVGLFGAASSMNRHEPALPTTTCFSAMVMRSHQVGQAARALRAWLTPSHVPYTLFLLHINLFLSITTLART